MVARSDVSASASPSAIASAICRSMPASVSLRTNFSVSIRNVAAIPENSESRT